MMGVWISPAEAATRRCAFLDRACAGQSCMAWATSSTPLQELEETGGAKPDGEGWALAESGVDSASGTPTPYSIWRRTVNAPMGTCLRLTDALGAPATQGRAA